MAATIPFMGIAPPQALATEAAGWLGSTSLYDGDPVRLELSTTPGFVSSTLGPASTVDDLGCFRVAAPSLLPNQSYYWRVVVDGVPRSDVDDRGLFYSPPSGPQNLLFTFDACHRNLLGDVAAFDAMMALGPTARFQIGDLFYLDPTGTSEDQWFTSTDALAGFLSLPKKRASWLKSAGIWIPDDHELCVNDGHKGSTAMAAMCAAYRRCAPSWPLGTAGTRQLFQTGVIGRVRIIVTDGRSGRDVNTLADTPPSSLTDDPLVATKSLLGNGAFDGTVLDQRAWLFDTLAAYEANPDEQLCVLVLPNAWVAYPTDNDCWNRFAVERAIVSCWLASHVTKEVVIVCADTHNAMMSDDTGPVGANSCMTDFSNGSNTWKLAYGSDASRTAHDPAADRFARPVRYMVNAPMRHQQLADRGGPCYVGGVQVARSKKQGQFGYLSIVDDGGDTITADMRCLRTESNSSPVLTGTDPGDGIPYTYRQTWSFDVVLEAEPPEPPPPGTSGVQFDSGDGLAPIDVFVDLGSGLRPIAIEWPEVVTLDALDGGDADDVLTDALDGGDADDVPTEFTDGGDADAWP